MTNLKCSLEAGGYRIYGQWCITLRKNNIFCEIFVCYKCLRLCSFVLTVFVVGQILSDPTVFEQDRFDFIRHLGH